MSPPVMYSLDKLIIHHPQRLRMIQYIKQMEQSFLSLVQATLGSEAAQIEKRKFDAHKEECAWYRCKQADTKNWGGFSKPEEPLSDQQIHSLKTQLLQAKQGDSLTVHHPYYRKLLHDFTEHHGGKLKGYINHDMDYHHDSTLIVHSYCKEATPAALIRWHEDYGMSGQHMGSYAICDHCDEHIHNDHMNSRGSLGWRKTRGKNALKVVIPIPCATK